MLRVQVTIGGNLDLIKYEADVIVYQQAVEPFNVGKPDEHLKQVPAIVVRLDSGEIKVQPLQMDLQAVTVMELKPKALRPDEPVVVPEPKEKNEFVLNADYVVEAEFKLHGEFTEPQDVHKLVIETLREFVEFNDNPANNGRAFFAKTGLDLRITI